VSTAGPNNAGTVADDASVGTTAWSNVTNAQGTTNSTFATNAAPSAQSHYLKATNFGFSVPSGATINGITVTINKKATTNGRDVVVSLVKGGTVSGSNLGVTATNWPNAATDVTYGSTSNLWGNTLTDTDVNASTFGVVISVRRAGPKACTCSIDSFSISIDYTASSTSQKTVVGLARASVKTIDGLAIASVKTIVGLA
jgi:hypothetical protein